LTQRLQSPSAESSSSAPRTTSDDLQKELVQELGELSGKPATSKLHIHPVSNASREDNGKDDEISVIFSVQAKKLYADRFGGIGQLYGNRQSAKDQWHSEITFEPIPSDYALLRLTQLPTTGGDTLWASSYEVYDRISPTLRSFLDSLTGYYAQPGFNEAASRERLQNLQRAARRARERRRGSSRPYTRSSAHQPGDGVEERVCRGPPRETHQWAE
jgi:alpha-ketoglutarate-dependent taurine dioxygenase